MSSHSFNVYYMNASSHFVDQNKRSNSTKRFLKFRWQYYKIISTNWCKLYKVSVLIEIFCVLFIMRDQLLGVFVLRHKMVLNKLYQAIRMTVGFVMEIKTIPSLLNSDCFLVSFMSQYQLFEIKESSLVMYTLSYLYLTGPGVRCPSLFAIIALLVLDYKFNPKSLLKHSVILDFLLNNKLHFHAPTMRFCPNKSSIDNLNFVESLHVL